MASGSSGAGSGAVRQGDGGVSASVQPERLGAKFREVVGEDHKGLEEAAPIQAVSELSVEQKAAADVNGDGIISRRELREFLSSLTGFAAQGLSSMRTQPVRRSAYARIRASRSVRPSFRRSRRVPVRPFRRRTTFSSRYPSRRLSRRYY